MATETETPEPDAPGLTEAERHRRLGAIMLREVGPSVCEAGYGTTDPEWVGRYALGYGDIEQDGTLT